jgi:hypothetical protein
MIIGVKYTEVFEGTYFRLDKPELELPLRIQFEIRASSVRSLLLQRSVELGGTVTARDLCDQASLSGTVGFKISARRVPYEFWFQTEGARVRFLGEKDIHPVWPRESLEVLSASIFRESGAEFARARVRYRTESQLWNTLKSLRVTRTRSVSRPFASKR